MAMYSCKRACRGGSRRLPLASLAALAAAALVAGSEPRESFSNPDPAYEPGEADVVEVNNNDSGVFAGDATIRPPSFALPHPAEQGSPEDVLIEESNAEATMPGAPRVPIVLSDGQTVGEMKLPQLDRTKRKLSGLKTLMVSAMFFFYILATKNTYEITTGEKVALSVAVVALGQYLYSLFSMKPKYEYSVVIKRGKDGQQRAELEDAGLAAFKGSFLSKLKSFLVPLVALIPMFFLVSGVIVTLGYATTVSLTFSFIVTIIAVLGALSTGFGESLAELFKQF